MHILKKLISLKYFRMPSLYRYKCKYLRLTLIFQIFSKISNTAQLNGTKFENMGFEKIYLNGLAIAQKYYAI